MPAQYQSTPEDNGRVGRRASTRSKIQYEIAAPRERPPKPARGTVQADLIPAVLRVERRWVCWDWRWPRDRDDWAKTPLNPRTRRNARSNDPATWGTFEEALAHYDSHLATTSGVGFMLGDGWVGVDVDDCVTDDGEVSDFAVGIFRRLDTYAEVSPSGAGIKAVGRGVRRLPRGKGAHDSKLGLEVYSRGRFFTLTGRRWHGEGVADIADAITWLYDTHLPQKKDGADNKSSGRTSEPPPPLDLADEEVIALMTARARNCAKVVKLWRGDMSDYLDNTGKPDESRADAALCSHVAFYTQDPARIDRLFRQSELGKRSKWAERADYREMTIGLALRGLTKSYKPSMPVKVTAGAVAAGETLNGHLRVIRIADSAPAPTDHEPSPGDGPAANAEVAAGPQVAACEPVAEPAPGLLAGAPAEHPAPQAPELPPDAGPAVESPDGGGPPDGPPDEPDDGGAEDDGQPRTPRPEGPYDIGGGFSVQFRHEKRDMTVAFLFRDRKGVDTERLNVRSGARRNSLVSAWVGSHEGLDGTKLAAALTEFAFYDPAGAPAPADDDDGRPVVELTGDEYQDRMAVLSHLADDSRLFVRDGILVEPKVHEPGDEPERPNSAVRRTLTWQRAPGTTALVPATVPYVQTRITAACRLVRPPIGPAPCPGYLPSGIHAAREGIREVRGLALGPLLRPDGSLINVRGYDDRSGLYLAADVPGLERLIPDRVSADMARQAIEDRWVPLLKDFPWRGADEGERQAERSRWYCLLFTALLRHMLGKVPLGLVTANNAGSGKSYLCEIIGIVAHGHEPILMTWPEGSHFQHRGDEVRKRLASLLHESASLALIDNLARGAHLQSSELEAFLTATAFYDRQLGRNDGSRVGGVQKCQLLATGNNVVPSGDTADRTLHVRLEIDHPNPRARPVTQFACGDAGEYARTHRRELLAAALTCVRGWIQAGLPCPPGESWGSFGHWTERVVGLVRWLYPSVDPLAGRSGVATSDPETVALAGLVGNWERVVGPEYVSVGRILREVEDKDGHGVRRALNPNQEALRDSLMEICSTKTLPSNKQLGIKLAGFVSKQVAMESEGDETRYGWLEVKVDGHTKANTYRVLTKVTPTPDLFHAAGSAGSCG